MAEMKPEERLSIGIQRYRKDKDIRHHERLTETEILSVAKRAIREAVEANTEACAEIAKREAARLCTSGEFGHIDRIEAAIRASSRTPRTEKAPQTEARGAR